MPGLHPDTQHPDTRPDTQWPRWEVFKQDSPKKPHQAVGSVHAADPEHALLSARNVFARRPSAVSLWVARAEAILSLTREERERGGPTVPDAAHDPMPYLVFVKTSHKRSMTFTDHVGEVVADSPQGALEAALSRFPDALAWWLVPADALHRSDPEDAESWFDPAKDKTYKQQSAYGFVKPQGDAA
jgi:ring-1,2-phenylacetyl-CoA epoxidase subunit PaaB